MSATLGTRLHQDCWRPEHSHGSNMHGPQAWRGTCVSIEMLAGLKLVFFYVCPHVIVSWGSMQINTYEGFYLDRELMSPRSSPSFRTRLGRGAGSDTNSSPRCPSVCVQNLAPPTDARPLGLVTSYTRAESSQGFKPVPEGGPHRSTNGCTCAHDHGVARLATPLIPLRETHTTPGSDSASGCYQTTVPCAGGAHCA